MTNEIKPSKRQKMASEGVLNEQYTFDSWFVKIKAAYGIDRVCFSFAEKGTNGKGFDVYVGLDTFCNWMEDVQNYRMYKIIEAEKASGEKYPKAYKFVTGFNGEKSVGFAPASFNSAFAVINGTYTSDSGTQYANVPVDYNWLRTAARWFFLTSDKWYENMAVATVKGSNAYRNKLEESDTVPDSCDSKPSESKSHGNNNPQNKSPKGDNKSSNKANNRGNEKSGETGSKNPNESPLKVSGELLTMNADSNSIVAPVDQRGNYKMEILDDNGKPHPLILPASIIKETGEEKFARFIAACETSKKAKAHSHFIMSYKKGSYNGNPVLVFMGFPKL